MDDAAKSVEAIFTEAVKQPLSERDTFLASTCGDDTALRRRVELLLKAHDEAGSFMDSMSGDTVGQTVGEPVADDDAIPVARPRSQSDAQSESPGTVIGRYKLLQKIGEGGFGVVYMADQEQPVKRRVALKVIKAGMDTKQVIARFEAERQALAMMDHPNIARVLDAGATDNGRPYFVMELVKGIPITQYCDEANLDMRQRLELFKDVCSAVQHAHQKGVIHRDLKPSNIMITLHDGKPIVKVIDFGIAKATEQKLTEKTLFTNYGQMIGTPTYMSPEQAVMSGLDIDTRSDIYSLGVLLYELLTGGPPFDTKTLQSAGFDEMRRIIREQEPHKPSTRLSTMAAEVRLSVAAKRHVSPAALAKELHGDLDWIVMKALEKDRARRYESASAFAQDVDRHLRAEPVSAAAPTAGYRLRKFATRNKGPVTVAAVITLLLIAGTAVSTWQAVVATKAREVADAAVVEKIDALNSEAEQRRLAVAAAADAKAAQEQAQKRLAQVEKANIMLGSIFKQLSPRQIAQSGRPLQAVLVEKLDDAVAQLDGEAIGDPLVVAGLQSQLGVSLLALGEPAKALLLLEKARNTYRDKLGTEHPDTLQAMFELSKAYLESGRLKQAVSLGEETLRRRTAYLGVDHPSTLASMAELADAFRSSGELDRAVELLEETLALRKKLIGPDHHSTLTTMNNLAHTYAKAGRLKEAVPLFEVTLEGLQTKLGPAHPDTLVTMVDLVDAYTMSRRYGDAVSIGERALLVLRTTLGPEHPATLTCINNLAIAYQWVGRINEAVPLFEQTHNFNMAKHGSEHPSTLASMNNLAAAYWRAGQLDQSIPLFEENLKLRIAKLGPHHPQTLETKVNLGVNYNDAGRYGDAVPLLEEGFVAAEKLPQLRYVVSPLLIAYFKNGQKDKFTGLFDGMVRQIRSTFVAGSVGRAKALTSLSETLLKAGAHTEAETILRESLPILENEEPDNWRTFDARRQLGQALLGQKKYADAEPLLLAGHEGLKARVRTMPAPARVVITQTVDALIELYMATAKPQEAAKWRTERAKGVDGER